ncbi:putative plastid-lipid-associated protein 8, chloroplastic [Tetrabaena socialis]|uniref:Putative plastid-lipid-associated protein 8, chloroplastic n=1 Tax=Tetrabaena socialis TaxID=47790 RepID=A0A2J8AIE9_9CHLO|nr:putative plastid-lipid-associated protein 8, chloroplastic [Tetrabaena socialis]|eukprot:PNH12287.1 putative plastid-lipid-associated protein 8, chloroplastic [Tetrabaena socialis]
MQALLSRRAAGANVPTCRGGVAAGCKRVSILARAQPQQRRGRRAVECNAFFNFFTPKPAAPVSPVDLRAKPLVEALINLTSSSDAGAKASPELKEEIAEVVTELSRYCMKNPLKSDLLWGEWKVLFSSKPSAVGGPLRSGAGTAVFRGQNAKQVLEAPNKLTNIVDFKTLGFLPGYSRQFGEIEPIDGDTFILNITNGELVAGLGGPVKKDFNIQRKIKILYLDDEIRIALFLPSEDLPDTEADENGGRSQDDIVFVFQRITEAAAPEEEQSEDSDGEDEAPKVSFPFGGGRKLESAATVAERQVRAVMKEQRGGSSRVAAAPARPLGGTAKVAVPAARTGSQRGGRKQVVEEEEDPKERRKREQEEERARKVAEAEAKAVEAKAARERAEAERVAEREKQAAIKELLAQLSNEIKERQAEARDALKELKDIEKSAGAGLKDVSAARARVDEAEGDVKSVSAQLDEAANAKKEAEKAAKEARDVVVAAEKELRARIAAAAPVLRK